MNKTALNFIIGGAIKAGTSSVFTYLSAHPEICGSSVKETFFFTRHYSGQAKQDRVRYDKYFSCQKDTKVLLEASPNYLCYKDDVAGKIHQLLPETKLLFILRNPVDRLYSHFQFAKAKLQLPSTLTFQDYVVLCEDYSAGRTSVDEAGIVEKHLRALDIGMYAEQLENFYRVFPCSQIRVLFFDDLKQDQRRFMEAVCDYIGIDRNFYQHYVFEKSNVTFSGRVKFIHRIAMLVNHLFESIFRRFPGIKRTLVRFYKTFNQRQEGYQPMGDSLREHLNAYYAENNSRLRKILSDKTIPEADIPDWLIK